MYWAIAGLLATDGAQMATAESPDTTSEPAEAPKESDNTSSPSDTADSRSGVEGQPQGAAFDYQVGGARWHRHHGAYEPPAGALVVSRDWYPATAMLLRVIITPTATAT